jgi:hypothetical protein
MIQSYLEIYQKGLLQAQLEQERQLHMCERGKREHTMRHDSKAAKKVQAMSVARLPRRRHVF